MDKGIKLIVWCVVAAFTALMLIVGLFSCNSVKKATKHYNKAKAANIVTVAKLARTDWPCVTTKADTAYKYIEGTPVFKIDTQFVKVNCPQVLPTGDTVYKEVKVKAPCNCKDKTDTLYRTVTKTVRDSAEVMIAYADRDKALKDAEKYKNRAHTKGVVIWVLIGLFALYLLLTRMFKLF